MDMDGTGAGNAVGAIAEESSGLFDPQRPRYPSPKHLPHLVGLFFDYLACHFPFLERKEVMEAAESQTLPAVLANCLASLACRFSDRPELVKAESRASAGVEYADMSKVGRFNRICSYDTNDGAVQLLIVHMLSWPSLEVLQALVLIAWSEFGSGRDSGTSALQMLLSLRAHPSSSQVSGCTVGWQSQWQWTLVSQIQSTVVFPHLTYFQPNRLAIRDNGAAGYNRGREGKGQTHLVVRSSD